MADATFGIVLALIALFCWGFGDFFIQKSTREIGVWKSLFFNDLFAVVVLIPFVYRDLHNLDLKNFYLLFILSAIVIFAAVFDFTALKNGKISIVEPLLGIELPITVGLSVFFLEEKIGYMGAFLILAVFVGIVLVSTTRLSHLHYHRRLLERGVIFALLGAIAMGFMNFLVGVSSNNLSPLVTVWFFSAALLVVSTIYILVKKEWGELRLALKNHWPITIKQSTFDNGAWVAYAAAMTLIPISIATAISESYIVVSVLLGVIWGREKIKIHQGVGVIMAAAAVIFLAGITG